MYLIFIFQRYLRLKRNFNTFIPVKLALLSVLLTATISLWAQVTTAPILQKYQQCKGNNCEIQLLNSIKEKIKTDPKHKFEWIAWEIRILDSLGSTNTDSIAQTLPFNQVSKLKNGAFVYVYYGKKSVEESKFTEAIQWFYDGMKLAQINKRLYDEAYIQRQIGLVYLKLDEYKKAENHLLSSLHIGEEINDLLLQANALISLGNAVKEQNRYKEAVKYYNRSLILAQQLKNKRLIAGNYNNLGNVLRRTKKYNKALEYFFKALEMNEASNNLEWISFNYNNIGQTYQDLKNIPESINYFRKSCELKLQIGDSLNLISSYLGLATALSKNGDYAEAYSYLEKYNALRDTLNLREQATALEELETKYETEKKEAQIKQLQISGELQKERERRLHEQAAKNRSYVVFGLIALILLSLGILVLIRSNRQKQHSNKLLNEKNKEIALSHLALSEAMSELQLKNSEMLDSINYAYYIQQAALPNLKHLNVPELKQELFFAPKDIVSGDFYYFFKRPDSYVFGIGDCTGHGVPGAMVSLIGMNGLEKVCKEIEQNNTSLMVEEVNEFVVKSLHRGSDSINDGMDLSLCLFESTTKTLHFTGANHNGLIIRQKSKNMDADFPVKYENERVVIGLLPGTRRPVGRSLVNIPFDSHVFKCQTGDRIVLFSDGYSDQTGGEMNKKMKRTIMMNLLLASSELSIEEQINYMKEAFKKWKLDLEQVDDVCLMIQEIV
jgi:serine phosphatase RsbU (regulator of sigma subunit)